MSIVVTSTRPVSEVEQEKITLPQKKYMVLLLIFVGVGLDNCFDFLFVLVLNLFLTFIVFCFVFVFGSLLHCKISSDLTTLYLKICCEFESRLWQGALDTTLCDKDLRQFGGFLQVAQFPPPIKLNATI